MPGPLGENHLAHIQDAGDQSVQPRLFSEFATCGILQLFPEGYPAAGNDPLDRAGIGVVVRDEKDAALVHDGDAGAEPDHGRRFKCAQAKGPAYGGW